jgi:hypothetical protein
MKFSIFALVATAILLGIAPAFAQTQETGSTEAPYLEDPLPKLLKIVPDLKGLEPAQNQDDLPNLLVRIGDAIRDSAKKLPNLTSREDVDQTRVCTNSHSYGGCLDSEQRAQFNYLILPKTGEDTLLEEYRTDLKNRRISDQDPSAPKGQGFASLWLLFSPMHRAESDFRYLGRQKLDKHTTAFVVAFAQKPDAVKFPSEILLEGKSVPILYQGIAWIDQASFEIIRMRTDLLAPHPEIHLQQLTAEIEFGKVRISKLPAPVRLPTEVDITLEINTEVSKEVHSYSNYRLYGVETRIIPQS